MYELVHEGIPYDGTPFFLHVRTLIPSRVIFEVGAPNLEVRNDSLISGALVNSLSNEFAIFSGVAQPDMEAMDTAVRKHPIIFI